MANDDYAGAIDALAIILPPLPTARGNYQWSLCDLSDQAILRLEETLHAFWTAGYGHKPVVIMEQTKGGLTQDECNKYWGGHNCKEGYRKGFFKQNFLFPGGSCLLISGDGDGEVYYFRDNDPDCNPSKGPCGSPCADAWGESGGALVAPM